MHWPCLNPSVIPEIQPPRHQPSCYRDTYNHAVNPFTKYAAEISSWASGRGLLRQEVLLFLQHLRTSIPPKDLHHGVQTLGQATNFENMNRELGSPLAGSRCIGGSANPNLRRHFGVMRRVQDISEL